MLNKLSDLSSVMPFSLTKYIYLASEYRVSFYAIVNEREKEALFSAVNAEGKSSDYNEKQGKSWNFI